MNKKLLIEGMSCGHCKMRVEKALATLEGVDAVAVNLDEGFAEINDTKGYDNQVLVELIDEAGYDVVKIEVK